MSTRCACLLLALLPAALGAPAFYTDFLLPHPGSADLEELARSVLELVNALAPLYNSSHVTLGA